jgi:hypothetical protein
MRWLADLSPELRAGLAVAIVALLIVLGVLVDELVAIGQRTRAAERARLRQDTFSAERRARLRLAQTANRTALAPRRRQA